MKILIAYATFDGQTRRIATRIGTILRHEGHQPDVRPIDDCSDALESADAVILGGAVRYGHHAPALERFARANAVRLWHLPNAFFSVSLSAGGPGANRSEALRYVEEFRERTGWTPHSEACFAGALPYRAYNLVLRVVMKAISRNKGGETDTSRNHEYTSWVEVERFARSFAARLAPARAA